MKLGKIGVCLTATAILFALLICGCSGSTQSSSSGPDYADDEAMATIAKGLEARWAITKSSTYKEGAESLSKAVNAELDSVKALRDRQFEDSKMQEEVLAYINTLEDSLDVIDNYPYDSIEYYEKWEAVYNKRTSILKDFVDKYGLTVSQANQSTLDDLIKAGKAAQSKSERDEAINNLIENAVFEKTDNGYGLYTYAATITNNSEFSFKNIGVVLALYDGDNVRAGETYASINSWEKGETARFEAMSTIDAARVKPSVNYYDVAD